MDRSRILARMMICPEAHYVGTCALTGDPWALRAMNDILEEQGVSPMKLKIGQCYHIQTVTHYWVGRVTLCDLEEIVLEQASCVYSVGPLAQAFQRGELRRVEHYPPEDDVHISQGAVVCANPWRHALPSTTASATASSSTEDADE